MLMTVVDSAAVAAAIRQTFRQLRYQTREPQNRPLLITFCSQNSLNYVQRVIQSSDTIELHEKDA